MKAKVNSLFIINHLNFFSNETCNIQKKRVINLYIHVSTTATSMRKEFHLKTKVKVVKIMNAKTQARWFFNHIIDILQSQFWRINTFVIDTCSTMKTLWSMLKAFGELKHIFFISCDSHELQLLLDDILKLSWFVKILKDAKWIIRFFLAVFKELIILWKFQMIISINLFFWLEDTRCFSAEISFILIIFLFELAYCLIKLQNLNIKQQNSSSLSLLKSLSQFYWLIHILIIFFL